MTPGRCAVPGLVALSLLGTAALPAWPQDRAGACPDVSGHYRSVAHDTPGQADVLKALGALGAGSPGSEVLLEASAADKIAVHIKGGRSGRLSAQPVRVLSKGVDFDCFEGAVVLREVPAHRKGDTTFHEGRASVRLAPAPRSGLNFMVTFIGSERTAIFGYESARVSVPVPGTGVRLIETLHWPDIREPGPPPEPAPRQVSKVEIVARGRLEPLLHPVVLSGLRPVGNAVVATFKAPNSADVLRFEDRLRQAGVRYEVKSAPIWSNSGYFMEMLILPALSASAQSAAAPVAQRPSPFWVAETMNGAMNESGLHVTRVEDEGVAYVATLSVVGNPDPQRAIASLKLNHKRFAVVIPLSEAPDATHPNVRIARWKVLLREP